MSKYLRIAEAAERLGLSTSTIYHWTSSKVLPHFKLGQVVLIDSDELERFVEQHRVGSIARKATKAGE